MGGNVAELMICAVDKTAIDVTDSVVRLAIETFARGGAMEWREGEGQIAWWWWSTMQRQVQQTTGRALPPHESPAVRSG